MDVIVKTKPRGPAGEKVTFRTDGLAFETSQKQCDSFLMTSSTLTTLKLCKY
jgi:hypothetical protein